MDVPKVNRWLDVLWVLLALIGPALPMDMKGKSSDSSGTSTFPFATIPPPLDIAMSSHEELLSQQPGYTSKQLIDTLASVDAAVKAENKDLVNLACVMKMASNMGNQREAKLAVQHEITSVTERWRHGNLAVGRLGAIQEFLKLGYEQRNRTMMIDSRLIQLSWTQNQLIRAQPLFPRWIGYDFKRMYWDPWEKSKRQIQELDAPVFALNRESGRRVRIHSIRVAIQRDVTNLTFSLTSTDIEITQGGDRSLQERFCTEFMKLWYQRISQSPPLEIVLKDWYWQHLAKHAIQIDGPSAKSDFDMAWDDLTCREAQNLLHHRLENRD